MSIRKRRADNRKRELDAAAERVKSASEWSARLARVCQVNDAEVINVEKWQDSEGNDTDTGYTLEVKLPKGGASWRTVAGYSEALAADADLPEGCGVEVCSGASRGVCLIKVSTVNALFETIDLPKDATPLDFTQDFDIGAHRDRTLAMVNMRENSGILAGEKRSGKTNQLQAFITRFVRMHNLLVWVIDYNGGGVALPWIQAWEELGRPGRPPIDWVADNDQEVEAMVGAAVRIAKARKLQYQRHMRDNNTDLLPLTPEIPGVMIVTDEGAELLGDPKKKHISGPFVEILRIAGAVGVNELSCFLRATSDATGDPMVKQQSRMRVGMRMADEAEISYLFGWKAKVGPEDMPEKGFGAVTMDPNQQPSIFKGYRVLPSDINWMVENTSEIRPELDKISTQAAGDVYRTRWAEDRGGKLLSGEPVPVATVDLKKEEHKVSSEPWGSNLDPDMVKRNLRQSIEDAGGPTVQEQDDFERVLKDAGVTDPNDPSSWPDANRPDREEPDNVSPVDEADDDTRSIVFGFVKSMSPGGVSVQEIIDALAKLRPDAAPPTRQTITRWLSDDDRIWKPTGYKKYAVKPEEDR
jgi:hypothetical protein